MDRDEAIEMLRGGRKGIDEWNQRRKIEEEIPDLSGADLIGATLDNANLKGANLTGARLTGANFASAFRPNFRDNTISMGSDFYAAMTITGDERNHPIANYLGANLTGAVLRDAHLNHANLHKSTLSGAALCGAELGGAILSGAKLDGADFSRAYCSDTVFAMVDLSDTKGLDSVRHAGPSEIGIDTLVRSKGNIPEVFLRGCGVPESVIVNRFALIGAMEPIQFYSCFISYSTKDEEFAKRLHARMVEEKLRVWFAPEDVQGGKKLHEQVDRAIQVHDRLLLVLSKNSISSKWVRDEIQRARRAEVNEQRRKLFPIRLVDFKTIKAWNCFDADLAEDLAAHVRQDFIPDFSKWKDHDSFESGFGRLLRDLKVEKPADSAAPTSRASPKTSVIY